MQASAINAPDPPLLLVCTSIDDALQWIKPEKTSIEIDYCTIGKELKQEEVRPSVDTMMGSCAYIHDQTLSRPPTVICLWPVQ